jgi:hypothetical protein
MTEPAYSQSQDRPHIVLVIPRGEAVRNFLYSDTLRYLCQYARVTLLSVIDDAQFRARFQPFCDEIVPLAYYPPHPVIGHLRTITDTAHDRRLWSEVAKNRWGLRNYEAQTAWAKSKRLLLRGAAFATATNPCLEAMTSLENWASWKLLPVSEFTKLFRRLRPDLVFNCSHIHGPAGELPLKVAHRMGIPTAGFIFSWDNLTSRSRIFVPYDFYLVWNDKMRDELLALYPRLDEKRVFVTGTPQFDFHFKPEFWLERKELCRRIGIDPALPFILYTTGVDRHFPEEHHHVEWVARCLRESEISPRPQLVVRTYVKGTSREMKALAEKRLPGVVFPPVLWQEQWYTPMYEDLAVYTSLLRETCLGINAASTVSLELMMHDKPIINLGFDPPGSRLPKVLGFERHIRFDHFRPVVESGATSVAWSTDDMRQLLEQGLKNPREASARRASFLTSMFGATLDGNSGQRIAEQLLQLADGCERHTGCRDLELPLEGIGAK